MFKNAVAACLLGGAMFGLHASTLAASPKETVAAFHAALASGDRDKALAFLAPEIAIYEAGNVERSRDEYAASHLGADMEFVKEAKRTVLKQSERIDGNTAVVWEETETSGTWRGRTVHTLGTETAVLEKKGDHWSIVHVHWSSRRAK